MKNTIVLAGALAQKPRRGGHTWVFLQYLLGFKKLGWDVLFLDTLEMREYSPNVTYFVDVMRRAGLEDSYSLECSGGEIRIGLSRHEVLERVRRSAVFFNITGFLKDDEVLACAPKRVFLDIDPGFIHMWQELRLADLLRGYDSYVTIAANIGTTACSIPTCGLQWTTTRPPVVLDFWTSVPAPGRQFTTIATWRGAFGPLDYQGKTYRLRPYEFRKFIELPRRSGKAFQIALDIHEAEVADLALLRSNGWSVVDPFDAAGDPQSYQEYIRNSSAEIMIAKNMYVESNSGWFSDRSACYLASGRPVLVQDTGLANHYPTDKGVVAFTTMEEALAGAESISAYPATHSRAAREIAEEYFDSDKVLKHLLTTTGVC